MTPVDVTDETEEIVAFGLVNQFRIHKRQRKRTLLLQNKRVISVVINTTIIALHHHHHLCCIRRRRRLGHPLVTAVIDNLNDPAHSLKVQEVEKHVHPLD